MQQRARMSTLDSLCRKRKAEDIEEEEHESYEHGAKIIPQYSSFNDRKRRRVTRPAAPQTPVSPLTPIATVARVAPVASGTPPARDTQDTRDGPDNSDTSDTPVAPVAPIETTQQSGIKRRFADFCGKTAKEAGRWITVGFINSYHEAKAILRPPTDGARATIVPGSFPTDAPDCEHEIQAEDVSVKGTHNTRDVDPYEVSGALLPAPPTSPPPSTAKSARVTTPSRPPRSNTITVSSSNLASRGRFKRPLGCGLPPAPIGNVSRRQIFRSNLKPRRSLSELRPAGLSPVAFIDFTRPNIFNADPVADAVAEASRTTSLFSTLKHFSANPGGAGHNETPSASSKECSSSDLTNDPSTTRGQPVAEDTSTNPDASAPLAVTGTPEPESALADVSKPSHMVTVASSLSATSFEARTNSPWGRMQQNSPPVQEVPVIANFASSSSVTLPPGNSFAFKSATASSDSDAIQTMEFSVPDSPSIASSPAASTFSTQSTVSTPATSICNDSEMEDVPHNPALVEDEIDEDMEYQYDDGSTEEERRAKRQAQGILLQNKWKLDGLTKEERDVRSKISSLKEYIERKDEYLFKGGCPTKIPLPDPTICQRFQEYQTLEGLQRRLLEVLDEMKMLTGMVNAMKSRHADSQAQSAQSDQSQRFQGEQNIGRQSQPDLHPIKNDRNEPRQSAQRSRNNENVSRRHPQETRITGNTTGQLRLSNELSRILQDQARQANNQQRQHNNAQGVGSSGARIRNTPIRRTPSSQDPSRRQVGGVGGVQGPRPNQRSSNIRSGGFRGTQTPRTNRNTNSSRRSGRDNARGILSNSQPGLRISSSMENAINAINASNNRRRGRVMGHN